MTETIRLRSAEPDSADPALADSPSRGDSIGRIVGLDAARAIAVFGMYYSHVGPYAKGAGLQEFLMGLPHGRSSALFATLAGLSLVLMAGGHRPKSGRPLRQTIVKIVIRSVLLLALGTWLTAIGAPVMVILAFYGLYFLLALPFIRLRARTLAILAGVCLVGGPVLKMWLGTLDSGWAEAVAAKDPLALWGGDGLLSLLLFGTYPAVSWMAYVFAGMAIGRLDLAKRAVQLRLLVIGPALALIGYGGAWLLGKIVPTPASGSGGDADWEDFDKSWVDATGGTDSSNWTEDEWNAWEGETGSMSGDSVSGKMPESAAVAPSDWGGLFYAGPHSGTPFELAGNIGVAFTVITGLVALLGMRRKAGARLRWWFGPLIAVGSMSLTVYVAHIAAIRFLIDDPMGGTSWWIWAGFVAAAMVFALAWKRFLKRGPLEWAMWAATKPARFVK